MRKLSLLFLALLLVFSFVGCSSKQASTDANLKIKPVKVKTVKEQVLPITLHYLGLVDADTTKKYSFKSSGKIASILVKTGESIHKGDKLIQLDTADLQYALDASKAQLDGAQAQYDQAIKGATDEEIKKVESNVKKATDAYNYAKSYYEKAQSLYQNGSISKQALDQAELQMNNSESDLTIAKQMEQEAKNGASDENKKMLLSQVEQARANYEQKKDMLDDSLITSDINGYVIDVLYKEGEMVAAGYPVVVARNDENIVNVGLTQEDVDKVILGTKAIVEANGKQIEGKVITISPVPDNETRTYNAQIQLNDKSFKIGTIVKVTLNIGSIKGILVPITSIMSNGKNYVFVNQNQTAKKQVITIDSIQGTNVIVKSGLSNGTQIVIEGMKELTDGEEIQIQP